MIFTIPNRREHGNSLLTKMVLMVLRTKYFRVDKKAPVSPEEPGAMLYLVFFKQCSSSCIEISFSVASSSWGFKVLMLSFPTAFKISSLLGFVAFLAYKLE